eukprot:18791-Heterococcus_DN1.PRE.2
MPHNIAAALQPQSVQQTSAEHCMTMQPLYAHNGHKCHFTVQLLRTVFDYNDSSAVAWTMLGPRSTQHCNDALIVI